MGEIPKFLSAVAIAILVVGVSVGFLYWLLVQSQQKPSHILNSAPSTRSYAERTGSYFNTVPADPHREPFVTEIAVPPIVGSNAIWGASGRDDNGHTWFGLSVEGAESAHLLEYIPESGEFFDRGDVVTALKRSGVYRPDERQQKIHSRIVQANDGYLYFASMDEAGERADDSRPPTWGSHLWRIDPADVRWEHLYSVPEGLIAISGAGRWVYGLAYWGHVLYQFDTQASALRSTRVGSVNGHVSRNLLADGRGHVYVPRLRLLKGGTGQARRVQWEPGDFVVTTLVEFDESLREIAETPLLYYIDNIERPKKPGQNHGIVSFTYLADGSMVFATSLGFLYRVIPSTIGPARVLEVGWFHPEGTAYTPSLFTFAGKRYLLGVTRRKGNARQWLIYDLENNVSRATAFPYPDKPYLLLYGSTTRDSEGHFYLVGRWRWNTPIILRAKVETPSVPAGGSAPLSPPVEGTFPGAN